MTKAYETSGGYIFNEKQDFPKWLSLISLSPVLLSLGIILMLYSIQEVDKKEAYTAIAILVPVEIILFLLFYNMKLEKILTTNGLYYRWTPFQKKFRIIDKQDIEEAEIMKAPTMKYGSTWVPGYGWMHSARKGLGISIKMTNGKKVFFGSAEPESLLRGLKELIQSNRKMHW